MSRSRAILVVIILIVMIYLLTGGRTTDHNLFGAVDIWFKTVTGITLTQVVLAGWRLIVWLIHLVIKAIAGIVHVTEGVLPKSLVP